MLDRDKGPELEQRELRGWAVVGDEGLQVTLSAVESIHHFKPWRYDQPYILKNCTSYSMGHLEKLGLDVVKPAGKPL